MKEPRMVGKQLSVEPDTDGYPTGKKQEKTGGYRPHEQIIRPGASKSHCEYHYFVKPFTDGAHDDAADPMQVSIQDRR